MSDKIISPEQLAQEVDNILQRYSEITDLALKEATDKVAKATVAILKQTSPGIGTPTGTGKYAKAWTQSRNPYLKGSGEYGKVMHVKAPHYRLTHLLEYGHASRSGGRVSAQPHIQPAAEQAIKEFEAELFRDIQKGGSKV